MHVIEATECDFVGDITSCRILLATTQMLPHVPMSIASEKYNCYYHYITKTEELRH